MKKVFIVSLLFLFAALIQPAFSHSYHYEVQVQTDLISKNSQLSALKMTWYYDEEVSTVLLEDQKDLKKLGKKLITDLDLLGYFTQLKLNGKVLVMGKAENYKLRNENNTLALSFTLPLTMPIKINDKSVLSIVHEDPAEVAILYYDNETEITLHDELKKRCKKSVVDKKNFKDGEFPQIVKIAC